MHLAISVIQSSKRMCEGIPRRAVDKDSARIYGPKAGCAQAYTAFWFCLHTTSLVHRHLLCKQWDVGAFSPYLHVSGQPQRLYVWLSSS
jgi:hypothetical protein